jgi:competence protein ComEC
VLLSWYYGTFNLQPAQRYRLTFRAKQRHGGLNPGGFDYELWLVSRGIAATGYVREKTRDKARAPLDLDSQTASFLPQVERIRAHIRERLFAAAPTQDGARWAAALALGDQHHADGRFTGIVGGAVVAKQAAAFVKPACADLALECHAGQ